ncbi:MAG: hypothetical protein ACPGUI_07475, partial [Halarcobacter sp.]
EIVKLFLNGCAYKKHENKKKANTVLNLNIFNPLYFDCESIISEKNNLVINDCLENSIILYSIDTKYPLYIIVVNRKYKGKFERYYKILFR